MKQGFNASGLKGFPFVIFEHMIFIQHNPEGSLLRRLDMMSDLYALIRAKYWNSEYKTRIEKLDGIFSQLRGDHAPVENQEWNIPFVAAFRRNLDLAQMELYTLVADLKIIDAVTMGDGEYKDED